MTKKLLLVISLCLLTERGVSQELGVSIGAGYARIIGPSRYSNLVSSSGLGLRQSMPVNVGVRFTMPDEALTFVAYGMYRALSGQGSTFYTGQTPSTIATGETKTQGAIWSGLLEVKWSPSHSATGLYLELGVLASSFSRATTWFAPSGDIDISEHNVQYGLTVGGGWGMPFLWNTMLDFDAKYVIDGLFGRENEQQGLRSFQFVASVVIPIWSNKSPE